MKTLVALLFLGIPLGARDIAGEIKQAGERGERAAKLVVMPRPRIQWPDDDGPIRIRTDEGTWIIDADHGGMNKAPESLPDASGQEPATFGSLLSPQDLRTTHVETGEETSFRFENNSGQALELFWLNSEGPGTSYGSVAAGADHTQHTYAGHRWMIRDASGRELAGFVATPEASRISFDGRPVPNAWKRDESISPDGAWRYQIKNDRLRIFRQDTGQAIPLDRQEAEGWQDLHPFHWSPDSRFLMGFSQSSVKERRIHIVQSSPEDQLQPKLLSLDYAKPGDPVPERKPVLIELPSGRNIPLAGLPIPNPWDLSYAAWAPDSASFTFLYDARGHQTQRIIRVDAPSGTSKVLLEETSDTFIDYSQKTELVRLEESNEFIWASERSGHNHLYLFDAGTGALKHPITRGAWNVREIVRIDEEKRTLVLKVLGIDPAQDPYHAHFIQIGFDGNKLIRLTDADGHHSMTLSPDGRFMTCTWSRADHPPVTEIRRMSDGRKLATVAEADDSALRREGWHRPERFVAKGRDGTTDIHGIILKPSGFDPAKRYPVVEQIYAGPHDHHVPKSFQPWSRMQSMAELGFIVVAIDGMGTNWRSKDFHDVCWKNLRDSGFPDRIRWIESAATSRPWMDLTRVGLYGGSAGGQSTLAGLLHHGDFYHVGVADCGCHDNRMDKIWWNEAWMGWPVDESYTRNSNITHVGKLRGKLMLIVGELDENVDPASTYQVVAALQKARKVFDFVPVINAGHGAAETPYGTLRRAMFLTTHLGGPQ